MSQASAVQPARPDGVGPETWGLITHGLWQRMRLLDALARQVYAPDTVPFQWALPTALTLGHGDYMPMLHGLHPLGSRWLSVMSFDIACDPLGAWRVLAQSSRSALPWPSLQSDPMLHGWLSHWQQACPPSGPEPTHWVVLRPASQPEWTGLPGTGAHGGISSARASDLLVRHQQLFLQTGSGLKVVHGLINLQGHDTLDPLEQPCEPDQGIAGLFEVLRCGQVLLLNPPGLAFLDAPAWLGLLPSLCQQALNEDLSMPSVESWWCGEPEVWPQILRRGADLWIRPTYPDDGLRAGFAPQRVDNLSDVQRSAWAHKMRKDGASYTLQKQWSGGQPWRILALMTPQGQGSACCLGPAPASLPLNSTPHLRPA